MDEIKLDEIIAVMGDVFDEEPTDSQKNLFEAQDLHDPADVCEVEVDGD